MDMYIQLLLVALATAAVAMTVTKAHITEPLREWVNSKNETAGYLIRCPYCTSHWVVFVLLLAIGASPARLEFWLHMGAVIAVSTLVVGLMLRALFTQETEIEKLRAALKAARLIIATTEA